MIASNGPASASRAGSYLQVIQVTQNSFLNFKLLVQTVIVLYFFTTINIYENQWCRRHHRLLDYNNNTTEW